MFPNIPFFSTGTNAKSNYLEEVNSLKDFPTKTLLIIGKIGTGKSALCNKIAGLNFDTDAFPVSAEPTSCTQNTVLANVNFNGDQERLMSLIDTMGFDDPDSDTDIKIITELVTTLKNNCSNVNLFGIAVNGQAPRLDGSLVAMIKIFEEMFGKAFWNQCVLIFTRMIMSKKEKERRLRAQGKSDDEFARDYTHEVMKKFPNANQGLKHLFIDLAYDEKDSSETTAFKEAMEKLYKMVDKAPKLPTSSVNENVHTDHYKLKQELKETETKLEETKKMQERDQRRFQEAYGRLAEEKERQPGAWKNYWKTAALGTLAGAGYSGGSLGAAVGGAMGYAVDFLFQYL